jgi:hypothetical protein
VVAGLYSALDAKLPREVSQYTEVLRELRNGIASVAAGEDALARPAT